MAEANMLYLNGPQKPIFLAKGLYAGLKHRDGLPAHLPIKLESGQEYINTGILDSLPCSLLRYLDLRNIIFNVEHIGEIHVSFYMLLKDGSIYQCQDYELADDENSISLPSHFKDL